MNDWTSENGQRLATRIERLWRRHPMGAASLPAHVRAKSKGQTWIAEQLGMDVRSVRRWLAGHARPNGSAMVLLDRLEREE